MLPSNTAPCTATLHAVTISLEASSYELRVHLIQPPICPFCILSLAVFCAILEAFTKNKTKNYILIFQYALKLEAISAMQSYHISVS